MDGFKCRISLLGGFGELVSRLITDGPLSQIVSQ